MNWLFKISNVPPWTQTWEEFIDYHKTGYISHGYGDEGQGYDLSHYNDQNQKGGRNSAERYPTILDRKKFNVPRYGEVEVVFRKSEESVRYVKTEEDADGFPEVVRDERGLATYLTEEEMQQRGLPLTNPTIHMFAGDLMIGHVGDSFGATELFVVREFQGGGIGPYLLKLYMESNPKAARSRLGQMTWQGIATAKKTWMMFVEDAIRKNENIPDDVLKSYEEVKQERINNPPERIEYDIPKYHTTRVQFGTGTLAPREGFNADLLRQMGVNFWDVEYDQVGNPQRWYMDDGGSWEDAAAFVESLGYQEEGYRTYNLKIDNSGEHGIIVPANS